MKKNFFISKAFLIVTLVVTSFMFTSCNDDDEDNNQEQTIAQIAQGNANLTTLVAALQRADLVNVLNGEGTFTVFAPTNAAFEDLLGPNVSVDDVPVATLRQILLNQVIATEYTATTLPAGYIKTQAFGAASTTNTLSMYVEKNGAIVTLNGESQVVTPNIEASNGIIHVVDAVIELPTVVDHAAANANFSDLVGYLSTANLVTTLDGTTSSPFTVFAPSNAAFDTFETQNPGALASLTVPQLTDILLYHVITGANVLSTGIPASATTAEGGTLLFSGTTITDVNGRQVGIVATDVQASNGVIHVLNNVLLP